MDTRLATLCFADVTGYKEDGREAEKYQLCGPTA